MKIRFIPLLLQLYIIKLCISVKTYENYTLFRAIPVNEAQVGSSVKSYENYTLFRAIPVNEAQMKYLMELPDKYDVQLWREPGWLFKAVDFTISPEDKNSFLREANESLLYLTTIHHDVQKLFNQQTVKTYVRRKMSTFDWNNYYRVNDINAWLIDLATLHPKVMSVFSIGTTAQKRQIVAVKISHEGLDDSPTVIVEGGIHAREWISSAFVTCLIKKLVHAQNDSDRDFKRIALIYNWVIVPILNPDGYEFTHTKDRLWRKNRNNSGVDINRNFDIAFGSTGVSKKESSDIYCGPKAFSEQEAVAMSELVEKCKDTLKYYLAFHSYGQYMIIPYAYTKEHLENFDRVKKMALDMIPAIRKRYGTKYTVGTAFDTVGYTTSGVSGCWVKKKYKIPYVITFELRDSGDEGFGLSPKHIIPTCQETLDGLIVLLDPRKPKYEDIPLNNRSENCCFKSFVLFVNFVMFIILCFDYLGCIFIYMIQLVPIFLISLFLHKQTLKLIFFIRAYSRLHPQW